MTGMMKTGGRTDRVTSASERGESALAVVLGLRTALNHTSDLGLAERGTSTQATGTITFRVKLGSS